MKISLVIPNRNNLKYFKWSYESIRKNQGNHEVYICSAADACTDETVEYYKELSKRDDKFSYIVNEGRERLGHTILYDRIVNELVKTDIFMIWHCDMYLCPNALDNLEKTILPGTVVSLTRIEPPLHPPGPEKIVCSFGIEPEEFDESGFLTWYNDTSNSRINKTTCGIFAPWAIYKNDFLNIGGHDPLYAPQSKEDSDIFNRFLLNGYKFIQIWEGCVYHMTCRGSRYNPTLTKVGKESNEWLNQNDRSTRNFIRKWGHFVKHDSLMKPIVPKKYDIGYVINNCNINILKFIEPWGDNIYVDINPSDYINQEQSNTKYNLKNKIKSINDEKTNDIIIKFDGTKLTNNNIKFIIDFSEIIEQSHEIGLFEYDIYLIEVKKINNYENNLININDQYYQTKLNNI